MCVGGRCCALCRARSALVAPAAPPTASIPALSPRRNAHCGPVRAPGQQSGWAGGQTAAPASQSAAGKPAAPAFFFGQGARVFAACARAHSPNSLPFPHGSQRTWPPGAAPAGGPGTATRCRPAQTTFFMEERSGGRGRRFSRRCGRRGGSGTGGVSPVSERARRCGAARCENAGRVCGRESAERNTNASGGVVSGSFHPLLTSAPTLTAWPRAQHDFPQPTDPWPCAPYATTSADHAAIFKPTTFKN